MIKITYIKCIILCKTKFYLPSVYNNMIRIQAIWCKIYFDFSIKNNYC